MCYVLIVNFPFATIVVYIANLSVVFINHLGMDLETFSYYQATTMGTFIIFSLFSVKLIDAKGLDYTKNIGGVLSLIGTTMLFTTCLIDLSNIHMICLSMAFLAAGGALMAGTFGMKAMSIFPEMNGTAMAITTAIRQLLASGLVVLSEIFFDGTLLPVAIIIFSYAAFATLCYLIMHLHMKKQPAFL
jgi:MFS transporter, DHA1 family, multidrug resistance protein